MKTSGKADKSNIYNGFPGKIFRSLFAERYITVTYPYMNMGNVYRIFITYIHRT